MVPGRWLLLVTLAVACSDKGDDSSGGGETTPAGFSVNGTAIDLMTQTPAAEGCAVIVLDPTPAVAGGVPTELASGSVGANGAYTVDAVSTTSTLGLLLQVKDCPGAKVVTTSTGLAPADYQDVADGGVVAGKTIYSISEAFGAGINGSLAGAGYTKGGIDIVGAMLAFVLLDDQSTPVDGATVTCSDCATFYYFDDAATDGGLFMTDGKVNTSTSAAAGAMAIAPAAPIYSYTAEDGGAHTFTSTTAGSQPGSVLIVGFYGTAK